MNMKEEYLKISAKNKKNKKKTKANNSFTVYTNLGQPNPKGHGHILYTLGHTEISNFPQISTVLMAFGFSNFTIVLRYTLKLL